jgi:hypothetical protein
MYLCTYVCIYLCVYVSMYIFIYVCMYVWICVCMCVCMYVCMHVWLYVCVCVYVCTCIYIYTYVYLTPMSTYITALKFTTSHVCKIDVTSPLCSMCLCLKFNAVIELHWIREISILWFQKVSNILPRTANCNTVRNKFWQWVYVPLLRNSDVTKQKFQNSARCSMFWWTELRRVKLTERCRQIQ